MEKKDKERQPHDKFFKQTFSRKEVILSFLKARLPKEIFNQIDQDNLLLTNREFVSATGKSISSDCIFKSRIKGTEHYIYLHVERQSEEDPLMLVRFLEYNAQLIRQHISEHGNTSLPAIVNICLYNGNKPYKGPTNFHDLFPHLKQVERYMFQGFHLVDLHVTTNEELLNWQQAAGAAMVLKQGIHRDFCEWLPTHQDILLNLEKKGYIPYISNVLWYMLSIDDHINAVELLDPKLRKIAMSLAERFRQEGEQRGRQEGEKKGRQEGIQIGEEKGKLEVAKSMLLKGYPIEDIIFLTGLSRSQIQGLL